MFQMETVKYSQQVSPGDWMKPKNLIHHIYADAALTTI